MTDAEYYEKEMNYYIELNNALHNTITELSIKLLNTEKENKRLKIQNEKVVEQGNLLMEWKEALKQISGISDTNPLRESELMRDTAKKALDDPKE